MRIRQQQLEKVDKDWHSHPVKYPKVKCVDVPLSFRLLEKFFEINFP